jgi:hypothetical protein
VLLERSQQQRMVDVVEQPFDIELQNPIVLPATLTRYPYGI